MDSRHVAPSGHVVRKLIQLAADGKRRPRVGDERRAVAVRLNGVIDGPSFLNQDLRMVQQAPARTA